MSVQIHNNIVYGPEEEYIPAHLSFGQFMFDQLKLGGHEIALISADTGDSITYHEILQKSVSLAVSLKQIGLNKNDVVAISSENRFEFVITALAVTYCGGVLSVLNITYTPGEITHLLNVIKPKYIFVSPLSAQNIYDACQEVSFVEKMFMYGDYEVVPSVMYNSLIGVDIDVNSFMLVDVKGNEDTLAIMCSSGTTGMPKGVMLTHVNILTSAVHMRYYFNTSMKSGKHQIKSALCLIPWFHAYGLITMLSILAIRVKIVFLMRFDGEQYLETIQKYKINMTMIVPPLAVFLAKDPLVLKYDITSLNEVWCGAAPLSKDIQIAISERTGLRYIKNGYGLTEVTMACCVDLTDGTKVGSCGTPGPGLRIKVVDLETGQPLGPGQEGELCIKSSLRMKGYVGDVESSEGMFDSDGFVRTGDVGYYDRDGSFYIVDRIKELIKYNGFQVAPAELEAVLLRHESVAEAGVVGVPDARAGELPAAFVVPAPGHRPDTARLHDHVARHVSHAKYLRGGIRFVDEIPKTPAGKILRRELKKLIKTTSKL